MASDRFKEEVVLVTGAGRRVGAEIARTLHHAGARMVVHYRSAAEEAARLVAAMNSLRPNSALAVQADLLRTEHCARMVDEAASAFGRLDAVVNNASSFYATPVGRIRDSDFDDLVGSNFRAPLFVSQAAAGHLKRSCGAIVNIVDIHAERPLRGYPLYSAAKAALAGLTRALALELSPEVRVNGVSPGPIQWPEDDSFDQAERDRIVAQTLLKRAGHPADIARAVLYLLADAPYVSGQIIAVDGGRLVAL